MVLHEDYSLESRSLETNSTNFAQEPQLDW